MTARTGYPAALVLAWLLCGVEPARCAAQAPPARAGGLPSAAPLPSSVSPEIEQFVRASGRDLPSRGPAPPQPSPVTARALPRNAATTARPSASRGPATTPRSPLDTPLTLKPAPLLPGDLRFPINLATALRLSDARPLVVAAAQARTWVAEAELAQAKVLWVPDLNVAFDYLRHDGGGPDFNKAILTFPSVNFFYGGAGLIGMIGTTDAYYQPLVSRQVLNSRQWDIQTAKNDALMQTADAYFLVHQYRGMYAGTLYTVEQGQELVKRLMTQGRDLVPLYEVDRARNMVADLQQMAVSARENWRVQSARLTRVLRLDPRAMVEPLERDHLQITLIDPDRSLDDLMAIALTNRPELASRQALVEAAAVRIRREKARPFLPIVLLNGYQTPGGMLLQAGFFGMGPNGKLNQWTGREDVSVQLIWQLQNFGLGNLAQIKKQRGQESRAIIDLRRTQDHVAEEVNQALARVQSASARVTQAERSLRTGIIAYNGSSEGLKQTSRFGDELMLISRPQEAIYALQLLKTAFDEYYTTVADYNRAQFELFHALGYPANEVTLRQVPGNILPADTARPAYLPPVGNGPPPATR